jgi:hypothetical protein
VSGVRRREAEVPGPPRHSFQDRVTVAAGLAAASTAVLTWVENNGTLELPDLIERAFDTLTHPSEPRSP